MTASVGEQQKRLLVTCSLGHTVWDLDTLLKGSSTLRASRCQDRVRWIRDIAVEFPTTLMNQKGGFWVSRLSFQVVRG